MIAKASDSVRSFGAYAVSRAVADTELVLRVGVVVASEISSRITPMLLPSARGTSLQCPITQPEHDGCSRRQGSLLGTSTWLVEKRVCA